MKFHDYLFNNPSTGDRIECGGFEGMVKAIGPMFADKGTILTVSCEHSGIKFELKVPATAVRVVGIASGKQRILDSPEELAKVRQGFAAHVMTFDD